MANKADKPLGENGAYWSERTRVYEQSCSKKNAKTSAQIGAAFSKANSNLKKDLEYWYNHLDKNGGISLAAAQRQLAAGELAEYKWDVDEYIKNARESGNGKWLKELERVSGRVHISRLDAMQLSVRNTLETAFWAENSAVAKMAADAYNDAVKHTAEEVGKLFGVDLKIGEIDNEKIQKLIKKPWVRDARTFSDRILAKKNEMIGDLQEELVRSCIYGRSPDETIARAERFINTKFESAKNAARRLVVTESAYFRTLGTRDELAELGVKKFQVDLPINSHSCEVCRAMNGRIFPISEFKVGLNAPPFHPNCEDGGIIPVVDENFGAELMEARQSDLGEENGLTNGSESGIIKRHKLAAQKAFSFSDYDVVSNSESIDKFKAFAAEQFNITHIQGIELLENGNTALEIIEPLKQLSEQYGRSFARISIMDFGASKTVAETLTNELRLNYQFMNRPDALKAVLDEWERTGYIPKGCNNASYVGRHEFFHLVTQDLINQSKSEIVKEVRRAIKDGVLANSQNGKDNGIHELVADLLAARKLNPKQQSLANKIIALIKR